ncbi:MAG: hypothetical protein ACR2NR_02320, partial [Solirubrobacteraceae bacterium]
MLDAGRHRADVPRLPTRRALAVSCGPLPVSRGPRPALRATFRGDLTLGGARGRIRPGGRRGLLGGELRQGIR